ncbi:MAG: uracil phosphoribosyltransferase [Candidatus Dormibacteraeota bacterium]|nr:uracil phosphoribosyltransferase [Candidatus Dormibacteraeota bacterium]
MPLHVSRHPLVQDCLAGLRDRRTPPREFRALAGRIIALLLYEATADLSTQSAAVATPLTETEVSVVEQEVVAIPVLRAGLGILSPVVDLLPRVSVGYIGLQRDEETAVARIYYQNLPRLEGRVPLLLDPMLATGGSASQAAEVIHAAGGRGLRMICVVAAPEGVDRLERAAPGIRIFTAALDQGLNDKAYIVPGLGDFGDRLFGTM